jgi:ribosomal protein L11 methyltransferase
MRYIEIIATVPADSAEHAASLLGELTGTGVWTEAPFAQPDLESDAIIDAGAPVRVHAYASYATRADIERDAAGALQAASIEASVSLHEVDEEDWAESWKAFFHVERFGERLVVVPSWREFTPAPDDVVLLLDPGMAFGTGQHETTRMCMEAIERTAHPGMRVLDAGCGSGILAIAAAKLGASDVFAVDIDANCVRVTESNARANGVSDIVRARTGSLGAAWPFPSSADPRFDVAVANIIARVIVELAPALAASLVPGGRLIVSGIIGEREPEAAAALVAADLSVESTRAMGDWRCIEAIRRGAR